MAIKTTSDRCNMTHEHYINQPMQSVELRTKLVIAKNQQLVNSLKRDIEHPLIRKFSHVPFENY